MDDIKEFIKTRTLMNTLIVLVNIVVFIVLEIKGDTESAQYMMENGAAYGPLIEEGEYYRLFTSMFMHFGIKHIFSNMLLLSFLGSIFEEVVGKVRYLIIYLLGGLAGNVVSYVIEMKNMDYVVSAGASGAVFAVVGAMLYVVWVDRGRNSELSGRNLAIMAVLTIFQGMTTGGVDNAAHIGGLVAGIVLAVIVYRPQRI